MISLPNNCYCSELKVSPKNWKTSKASIREDWMVYYRFYDPNFKLDPRYQKGKLVRLKGMNSLKNQADRQAEAMRIIEQEMIRLKDEGYNPITNQNNTVSLAVAVKASTPFLQALIEIETSISASKTTKRDLKSTLGFVSQAARQIGLSHLPVFQVSRKHIKMLLAQIEANQEHESAHRFNKNRAYLMMLFKELIEIEAVETNPVREISKKQRVQPVRRLLAPDERKKINIYLKGNHYRFWLFTHIFFHSGARLTEMMQLKRKDVNLSEQTFKVTVKKGKLYRQVIKPIKNSSLPFWKEALQGACAEDFVFSVGLQPGSEAINTEQVTRRWKTHIKKKLKIEADFYSLKHLHLDEIASELSLEDAAAMASHTSTNITLKHYAVNERQRRNERLKLLSTAFA